MRGIRHDLEPSHVLTNHRVKSFSILNKTSNSSVDQYFLKKNLCFASRKCHLAKFAELWLDLFFRQCEIHGRMKNRFFSTHLVVLFVGVRLIEAESVVDI